MMTVDPRKRITIHKVLEHPWLDDSEMVTKVNRLLNGAHNENVLIRKAVNDNIPSSSTKHKRARLE